MRIKEIILVTAIGLSGLINAHGQLGTTGGLPSGMETAQFGGLPAGAKVINGETTYVDKDWINPTGASISIWGIQGDIWTDMFIPPGISGDVIFGPGFSIRHYFQSICDVGMTVTRISAQGAQAVIFTKGSDHYDNGPELNGPPTIFPVAFILGAGDRLHMAAFGKNGWQKTYGGQIVLNFNVLVYYTQP